MPVKGLVERLRDGEYVLVAEGYLFEFERRGYLQAGAFVPEVVLEHPEMVRGLTEEFVHAGTDVVEAFTYYGHREKLRIIGREDDLEPLNRKALQIAADVAKETGTLMAGNISNTTLWNPDDKAATAKVEAIFKEQIEWAVEAGAHFIVGETYDEFGEAMLALECIKKYGKGLPAVITIIPTFSETTHDGLSAAEACRRLEEAGAAVVGLNCSRGPGPMASAMEKVRKACKGPLACLPVPYRTTAEQPAMQDLLDPVTGERAFPDELDMWMSRREDIRIFTKKMMELDVKYMGICCGNRPFYMREMAETVGRRPPASRFSPNMNNHLSEVGGTEHKRSLANWQRDHNLTRE